MPKSKATKEAAALPAKTGKPSSFVDTRVIFCGDNLEQLAKLPDAALAKGMRNITDDQLYERSLVCKDLIANFCMTCGNSSPIAIFSGFATS